MLSDFLNYTTNQLPTIMTGLTMAMFGAGVYEARDGFFLSGNQFRGKYEALMIFLFVSFCVSLITPIVSQFWQDNLPYLHEVQILGAILIMGMISVNQAAEWNTVEVKSIVVYLIGGALIVEPNLLYAVF